MKIKLYCDITCPYYIWPPIKAIYLRVQMQVWQKSLYPFLRHCAHKISGYSDLDFWPPKVKIYWSKLITGFGSSFFCSQDHKCDTHDTTVTLTFDQWSLQFNMLIIESDPTFVTSLKKIPQSIVKLSRQNDGLEERTTWKYNLSGLACPWREGIKASIAQSAITVAESNPLSVPMPLGAH